MAESKAPASRSKKFMKDLGIYAIGNLGSKLITFLLVPLYTFFIDNPAEFGYYDLCINTAFCLIPLVGLQLNEGAFRFLMDTDSESQRTRIVSFVYRTLLCNSSIVIVLGVLMGCFFEIKYLGLSIAFGLGQTFYDVVLQIVRGLGRVKYFVGAGICNTLLIALTSIVFVVVLDMGIPGIFIGNIIARFTIVTVLNVRLKIFRKYFRFNCTDGSVHKDIINYSLPLIPAALCWWFITNSNIYFLSHYCGLTDTGLYGFVGRFTGILFILSQIFYQTWQQNALEQYDSPDRTRYFSEVFNNYFFLLSFLVVVFSFGIRIFYPIIIASEFQVSAQYIYVNSVYVMLSALAQFYELGYQCSKQTRYILPSLVVVAIANIVCNWIFVQVWAIYGVIFSNVITWGVLLLYRVIDTRRFMHIHYSPRNLLYVLLLVASGCCYYYYRALSVDIIMLVANTIFFVVLMPKTMKIFLVEMMKPKIANDINIEF